MGRMRNPIAIVWRSDSGAERKLMFEVRCFRFCPIPDPRPDAQIDLASDKQTFAFHGGNKVRGEKIYEDSELRSEMPARRP
jgi:hypothetical protein